MFKLSIALALLPLFASAAPNGFSPSAMNLPRNARSVAFDEVNKRFIAFDHVGREIGVYGIDAALSKRVEGTCTPMSNADIGKLPGIKVLRDEATKNWGNGKRNEVVNDKDFTDSPANVCSDDDGVLMVYDAEPSCKNVVNKAEGTLEGGKITLENNEGVSMSTTTEVTRQSSFAIGTKISASFKFPEIAEVSTEISTTSTITNTQGTANTVSSDMRTLQRIEQTVDEGQHCELLLESKSCQINGKGALKMVAQGLLWFQYEKRTQGHYKWGLVMEAMLPNEDDRASIVAFKTSGSISSSGHFSSSGCTVGETVSSV